MNKLNRRLQMAEAAGGGGGGGGGDGGAAAAAAGGGGGGDKPFYDSFTDPANKSFAATKGWKGVEDAIASSRHLETLVGAEKAQRTVILPKDDKDVEGIKALNARLGVPEKPEGYGFAPKDANNADEVAQLSAIAGYMHARNIPKAAAAGLFEDLSKWGADQAAARELAAKTKSEGELAALNTEWGTAAKANTELAKRFAGELGITADQMSAIEGVLGTATFLKMFHKGGTKLGEQTTVDGGGAGGGGGFGVTQAAAQAKLDEARDKRIAGNMSEKDYQAIQDQYGPIAHPDQKAA